MNLTEGRHHSFIITMLNQYTTIQYFNIFKTQKVKSEKNKNEIVEVLKFQCDTQQLNSSYKCLMKILNQLYCLNLFEID